MCDVVVLDRYTVARRDTLFYSPISEPPVAFLVSQLFVLAMRKIIGLV